ncbi:MAG: DUF2312 domain-containing protein, partial [Alphaproteobacteria bacterium]|nr:DUF2312 domain-containing protein [Alphaproteobacteria bacterium]
MTKSNVTPINAQSTDDIPSGGPARLKSLIERIEKLEEEKTAIAGDIKDVFAEAK